MARVLVVDDSRVARETLKAMLTEMGHEVVDIAQDGKEAFLKYKECSPDFMTLDVNMPEVDGVSAARNILRLNSSAKIILVTSYDENRIQKSSITEGAVEYIMKPVEQDVLECAIKKFGF